MIRALLAASALAVGAVGAAAIAQRDALAPMARGVAVDDVRGEVSAARARAPRLIREPIYDARGVYSAVAMDALDPPEEPADAPPAFARVS